MANQIEPNVTEAVKTLEEAVKEFSTFISRLPDEALVEKMCGPKEVLAHLVFWLESYVSQSHAILAGDIPKLHQGHFDELNANAIEASRGLPVTKLLHRHQIACDQLGDVTYTHDANKIVLTLKKGSSFRHPLTKYLTAEAGHIRWHRKILERQFNKAYLSDINQLQAIICTLCQFIHQLPKADLVEQTWGPKEVLAHLVFWHERCIAQVKAIVDGKPFVEEEKRIKDLNALAVKASRDVPVSDLLRRLKSADKQLRYYGQTLDPQNVVVKVHAHLHTLDGAILSLASHISNHHKKLVKEKAGHGHLSHVG